MRRLLFILFAASLTGLGCNSTGKKPAAPTGFQGKESSTPFWNDGDGRGAKNNNKGPSTEVEGMLAGMLIDGSGRAQPNAVINVTPSDAGPDAKPIGIQADDQGYFMIKGLKAGTTYFLSVRGEDRGKVLGGSAMTEAPNTRLLIRLSEGNVSSVTPPPMANPADTGPFAPDKSKTKLIDPPTGSAPKPDPVPAPKDPVEGKDQSWSPGKSPPSSRPLPPPPPPPASRGNPNVADTAIKTWPPAALIPGSGAPKIELPPPPSSPSMSAVPSNSSPLVGAPIQAQAQRASFTLYDVVGNPVEFRNLSDRRLIVLDFWTTTCPPCLRKIPELIDLQSRYSTYMDVVGVACDNLQWAQRTKAVEGVKDYYLRKTPRPINYSIYFEGEGQEGRLQSQFKIKAYPTMILLDHNGKELWRGSNTPQLEEAIKYSLMRK